MKDNEWNKAIIEAYRDRHEILAQEVHDLDRLLGEASTWISGRIKCLQSRGTSTPELVDLMARIDTTRANLTVRTGFPEIQKPDESC